jgi:hypothetical protein
MQKDLKAPDFVLKAFVAKMFAIVEVHQGRGIGVPRYEYSSTVSDPGLPIPMPLTQPFDAEDNSRERKYGTSTRTVPVGEDGFPVEPEINSRVPTSYIQRSIPTHSKAAQGFPITAASHPIQSIPPECNLNIPARQSIPSTMWRWQAYRNSTTQLTSSRPPYSRATSPPS